MYINNIQKSLYNNPKTFGIFSKSGHNLSKSNIYKIAKKLEIF